LSRKIGFIFCCGLLLSRDVASKSDIENLDPWFAMPTEAFSQTCGSRGAASASTESAVAAFEANVEVNIVSAPEEIKELIINALVEEVVNAVARGGCSSRRLAGRKLELTSVLGDLPSFQELGSCLSVNEASQSCTTYGGAISLYFIEREPNSSEAEVITNALMAIKAGMNSTTFSDKINNSLNATNNVLVTQVTYAGPSTSLLVPSVSPGVNASSEMGTFMDNSSTLNPLGIGMVILVGLLAAVVVCIACCVCRNTPTRSQTQLKSTETKDFNNNDEERAETESVFKARHMNVDDVTEGGINRATTTFPNWVLGRVLGMNIIEKDGMSVESIGDETTRSLNTNDEVSETESVLNIPDEGTESDGIEVDQLEFSDSCRKTRTTAQKSRIHVGTLERKIEKAISVFHTYFRFKRKSRTILSAEIIDHHESADEEDERAEMLMRRVEELIASKAVVLPTVEFVRVK
jgi:Na+-transporting methylmalonyl-CoA/oxaloacetate decarboxylase gamma subunit